MLKVAEFVAHVGGQSPREYAGVNAAVRATAKPQAKRDPHLQDIEQSLKEDHKPMEIADMQDSFMSSPCIAILHTFKAKKSKHKPTFLSANIEYTSLHSVGLYPSDLRDSNWSG